MHQLGRIGQQTYCAVLFADVKSQKGKVFFSALSIAVDAGGSFSLPVKDQDFISAQHKDTRKLPVVSSGMVSTREKRSEYFWLSGKALSYERTMPGSNEDCFSVLPEKEQEAKNRKDRKIPEFLIIT